MAWPNSPHGPQRNIRTPESETLRFRFPWQKPQTPIPIGFVKPFAVSFTTAPWFASRVREYLGRTCIVRHEGGRASLPY
jgi:hypothetical protein